MRDEDDAVTLGADIEHDLEQLLAAVLGQGRGGLVDDQDLGVEPRGLQDLDDLALLEVVVLDGSGGLDARQAEPVEQLLGLLVHRGGVLDAVLHEAALVAEEQVLRDGEPVQGAELLDDDGDAVVVAVDLVLGRDLLAVEREGARADRQDARQHVGERGLAGAVLADQGVDLAGVEVEGDLLDRVRGAELLIDFVSVKQQLVCHGASLLYFTTAPLTRLTVRVTTTSSVAPVTTSLMVVGMPRATKPANIMEMMNSPMTMATTG